ncbi:MAG: mannose-1-phosphate guanylyltransferase [Propionibacterium sp.]|nr:mannose-1-phosphate guanylyltransferase [Propionibacterium sp.]
MRYVVIMAGGSGTRLWPLSRQGRPKQLLELFDGKSLLRLAFERLDGLVPVEQILVCTGRDYADDVAAQLPELPSANLLGEPVGRDSLNAVAWSAAVLAERDPDAVVAMVTADQIIEPVARFQDALRQAFGAAEEIPNALVTLGVVPTSPHTGYGYLHRDDELRPGVFRIAEFKEKPDLAVAEAYVASGEYWWNAGMFVWRAATLLSQLDQLLPATATTVREIARNSARLDELFPTLEKVSVDYAVMEPASAGESDGIVVGVPLDVTWSDVGGYASYAALLPADGDGNTRRGATVTMDSSGCIVFNMIGPDHVVATLGLEGMLVVATKQATLVADLDDAERVKQLVAVVADEFGAELA